MKSKRGFSLVFVSSLGLIMVLMALAVTSSLIPVYRNVGAQGTTAQAEAAAEEGIQYAIALLNNNPNPDSISGQLALPAGLTTAAVTVTVDSLDASKYSGTILSAPAANNFGAVTGRIPTYKRITSKAKVGVSNATIYSILRSRQVIPVASGSPQPLTPNTQQTPYFSNALFGAQSLSLVNNGNPIYRADVLQVLSQNSSIQAPVGSNQNISFSGRTVVDGSISSQTASMTGSSRNVINGNLTFNGSMTNNLFRQFPAFAADDGTNIFPNVLGDAVSGQTPGSVTKITNGTAAELAPVNSVIPDGAAQYSAPNVVVAPAQNSVVDLGAINLSGSETLTLPNGNYVASSISISDGASINVIGSGNATGLKITVQGDSGSSSGSAISIGGKGIQMEQSAAANLQIFYGGSENVNVSLGQGTNSFYGLLYAPNANVSVTLPKRTDFYGAVAGNTLTVTGVGTVHFDPASVKPPMSKSGTDNMSNGSYYQKPPVGYNLGFDILSWFESRSN